MTGEIPDSSEQPAVVDIVGALGRVIEPLYTVCSGPEGAQDGERCESRHAVDISVDVDDRTRAFPRFCAWDVREQCPILNGSLIVRYSGSLAKETQHRPTINAIPKDGLL